MESPKPMYAPKFSGIRVFGRGYDPATFTRQNQLADHLRILQLHFYLGPISLGIALLECSLA